MDHYELYKKFRTGIQTTDKNYPVSFVEEIIKFADGCGYIQPHMLDKIIINMTRHYTTIKSIKDIQDSPEFPINAIFRDTNNGDQTYGLDLTGCINSHPTQFAITIYSNTDDKNILEDLETLANNLPHE